MGRKSLPDSKRRSKFIKIRCNYEDLDILERLSIYYDLPKAKVVRKLIKEKFEEIER